MGAPAGSGGSDRSDERKVDTYADQLKKEQARKSKYKTNKFGYKVKKNVFERIGDNSPGIQLVKNTADRLNLNRRMKFANKQGINIQGLSTEQILSKDFKSKLDAKGYTKEPGNVGGGGNDRPDNNQPILKARKFPNEGEGETVTEPFEPSEAEVSQSEAANADDIYTRRKKSKARGRSMMTLTSSKGVTDNKLTLGKPSLLGS